MNSIKKCLSIFVDVAESDSSSELQTLPRNEVIQRLRERCEPILLFGESEVEAFRRLRRCEILEPEVNRVSTLTFEFYHLCQTVIMKVHIK